MADPGPERARRRPSRHGVRLRTTAAAVLVVALVLAAGAVGVVLLLRAELTADLADATERQADEVAVRLAADGLPAADDEDAVERALGEAEDGVVLVVAADGAVVLSSGDTGADVERVVAAAVAARLADDDGDDEDASAVDGPGDDAPLLVALVDVEGTGDRVVVGRSTEDVRDSTAALAALLAGAVPVGLVLIGVTTWVVVGRALRPVERIRAEVAEVTGGQLHRRVPQPPGDDEVARLARTMNLMLGRVESSAQRQQRFVSDASHELRSPLASVRQSAEVAVAFPDAVPGPELAATVLAEVLRMQGVVEDLLLLARADEAGERSAVEDVDLDDLLLVEARRLRARGTPVDVTGVRATRVTGDAAAMARVVRNLVDNASRHAATRVALAATDGPDGAVLVVDDDGPGIPAGDRRRVFDRFVRLDDARARDDGGSGLGLAIVAEVVRAHGGVVTAGESPAGGARLEVRLPRR